MAKTREQNVYLAKLAEQAERYEEMVEFMKAVCSATAANEDLSVEERNLVSVAFKNVVGARRAACRVIQTIHDQCSDEGKDEADGVANKKAVVAEYKAKVEAELDKICGEAINLVSETLIKNSTKVEAKVFYRKMAGDYYRYLCEFKSGDAKNDVKDKAMEQYKLATTAATDQGDGLSSTHPIRLGLALNFSVFYYEIFEEPDKACEIAKSAFDDAIAELDSLPEDSYKDATLIMQLLRDNLTLWTTDNDGDE